MSASSQLLTAATAYSRSRLDYAASIWRRLQQSRVQLQLYGAAVDTQLRLLRCRWHCVVSAMAAPVLLCKPRIVPLPCCCRCWCSCAASRAYQNLKPGPDEVQNQSSTHVHEVPPHPEGSCSRPELPCDLIRTSQQRTARATADIRLLLVDNRLPCVRCIKTVKTEARWCLPLAPPPPLPRLATAKLSGKPLFALLLSCGVSALQ